MASKLALMQARFQEKQMQEKEEKLLRLFENQQQRTMDRINRGSPTNACKTTNKTSYTISHSTPTGSTGKVRQMFDERRQKAGIDRNYPLEPLKNTKSYGVSKQINPKRDGRNNYVQSSVAVVQKKSYKIIDGKPVLDEKKVYKSIYSNNNGNEIKEETYTENNNAIDKNLAARMNGIQIGDSMKNQEVHEVEYEKYANNRDILLDMNKKILETNGAVNRKTDHSTLTKEKKPLVKTVITRPTKTPSTSTSNIRQGINLKGIIDSSSTKQESPSFTGRKSLNSPIQNLSPQIKTTPTEKRSSSEMSQQNRQKSEKAPSTARPSAKARQQPSAIVRDDLQPCKFCGRRFATDRLDVHEDICARAGKKQRKAYDATKHRVQGTELEQYVRKRKGGKGIRAGQTSDWRKKHEEFIATIRAAKIAQAHLARGGKISDLPPPPPSYNPDYVQCPHCGRRFNQAAAERHVPKCASYQFNKPKPAPPKASARSSLR